MPDNWIVAGEAAKPYDGRYPLVLPSEFNVREFGWAKRYADRLPANMEVGLDDFDAELFLVLALVAMHRADKIEARDVPEVFERLSNMQAPFVDTFWLEGTPDKEESIPDSPPPSSSNENGSSSGPGSPKSSATSAVTRHDSGSPPLATSESAPAASPT